MIDGKKVVAWTPYGRERTYSVLFKYLERDYLAGVIDEVWLCLNTDDDQISDLKFAYSLARRFPWIKIMNRPAGLPRLKPKQRNTGYFCRYMIDPETVYVRLDDDIVYVHGNAIPALVRHKLSTPEAVASFPVMWNNSVVSWFAQQAGVIPAPGTTTTRLLGRPSSWDKGSLEPLSPVPTASYNWPAVGGPYCMDPVGWANGQFAVEIHHLLLGHIQSGTVEKLFLYQDMPLPLGLQFSVSTFAALGSMYAGLETPGVLVPYEEESWHTIHQPKKLGTANQIVGDALVSHYTFFPQQGIVNQTDILDQYRALALAL